MLYNLVLFVILIFYLPFAILTAFQSGKYKKSFKQRFGVNFPKIEKTKKRLIWVHAVSVGETKAVAKLVNSLHDDDTQIIFSNVTETGHEEAKKMIPNADHHVFLPLDFSFIVQPIVKRAQPDCVIVTETDIWPNFLNAAKKEGAVVVLANAKMSARTAAWYRTAPKFIRNWMLGSFDKVLLQGDTYEQRFLEASVPKSKIAITGNLKLDDHYPEMNPQELREWKGLLGLSDEDKVLVIGSTHYPEEEMLLPILKAAWLSHPKLKVLLVPRHPERFNVVDSLLKKENIAFRKFSEGANSKSNAKLVLVDAMGVLRKCYQIADVALVAGSFTKKVGGHNVLEPSWYGVPVLFGPHMKSQPDLTRLALHYKSAIQVDEENLLENLMALLDERNQLAQELGENGKTLFKESSGALDKTLFEIKKMLN